MQFYEIHICQVLLFRHYTDNKKREDDKIWFSNSGKIVSIIANAQIILLPTIGDFLQNNVINK